MPSFLQVLNFKKFFFLCFSFFEKKEKIKKYIKKYIVFLHLSFFQYEFISKKTIYKNLKNFFMEVNIFGLTATALFIIIPTSFLLILYVKTASNESA
jgi:photosystem II PsbM protein